MMPSIKISAAMPELPRSPLAIFKVSKWDKTREKDLMNQLGMIKFKETAFGTDKTPVVTFSEGPYDLMIHRASGAFRFIDRTRWQVDDGSNLRLSDEEAIKIARNHLGQYKLPPEESRVLKVSHLHVATAGPEGKGGDHRIIDAGVIFQRTIKGVPVDGPGGKIIVYLDHEGKMTGIDKIWRPLGPVYREVKELHPPQHAVDEATRLWKRQRVLKAEVREVRLAYYEMGWDENQRFIQPAYIVMSTLTGPDERVKVNTVHVTPAALNHVGRILPVVKKAPTQASRKENK